MTIQAQAWIWEHSRAGGASKLVELALAELGSYGDDPSIALLRTTWLVDDLALKCNMDHGAVISALGDLDDLREVEILGTSDGIAMTCTFLGMPAIKTRGRS